VRPTDTLLIVPRQTGSWLMRTNQFMAKLGKFFESYRIGDPLVLCEWPKLYESEAGQAAAAKGDLVKLAFTVGRIAELAYRRGFAFAAVPVNDWKGTMDKDEVEHRIERVVGAEWCAPFHSHVWDAVGIGLWYRGLFK
jgi:hypothetical protein